MKIKEFDDHALVIEDYPLWVGMICFPAGAVCAYRGIREMVRSSGKIEPILAGALLLFVVGAIAFKKSVFDFDLEKRDLKWRRTGTFGRKGGTVPFGEIRSAVIQIHSVGRSPTYRLALMIGGEELPITENYSAGARERCETVRSAIYKALQIDISPEAAGENDILEMARRGWKIQAMTLARQRRKMSLAEAKNYVDGLSTENIRD